MVLDPYFYLRHQHWSHCYSQHCPLLVTTQIKSPESDETLTVRSSKPNPHHYYQIDKKSPSSTIDLVRPVAKMLSSADWTCDGFNKSLCQAQMSSPATMCCVTFPCRWRISMCRSELSMLLGYYLIGSSLNFLVVQFLLNGTSFLLLCLIGIRFNCPSRAHLLFTFLLRFVVIMESKEGIQPNFLLYADMISTTSIPLNRSNYAQ